MDVVSQGQDAVYMTIRGYKEENSAEGLHKLYVSLKNVLWSLIVYETVNFSVIDSYAT